MLRNFFSTPNVVGRLMIVLLFAGGVVFAGAFDGFVIETEASGCCGGGTSTEASSCCGSGTSPDIFSSSSCCDDEPDECGECGCYIAGCSDCIYSMLGCGSDENGDLCECGQEGGNGIGGNAADGCGTECPSGTDATEMCNNDCGFL